MTYSDIFDDEFTPHPKVMKFTFVPAYPQTAVLPKACGEEGKGRNEPEAVPEHPAEQDSEAVDMLPAVRIPQYAVKKNIFGKFVAKEIKK